MHKKPIKQEIPKQNFTVNFFVYISTIYENVN